MSISKIDVGALVRYVPKKSPCRLPLHPGRVEGIGIVTEVFKHGDDRKLNYVVRWTDDVGSTYGYHREELKIVYKGG